MKPLTLILARPRSRTAWLANLLSYGQSSICLHEGILGCGSLADMQRKLLALPFDAVGTADTALLFYAEEIAAAGTHAIVLKSNDFAWRRWVASITPRDGLDEIVRRIDAAYERALELVGAYGMVVEVDSLDLEPVAREIWSYFGIEARFSRERFDMLVNLRVESIEQSLRDRFEAHMASGGMIPPLG